MRLKITHRTEYSYDQPVAYALQRLRLVPLDGPLQTVTRWDLAIDGAREEVRYRDHFGNDTRLVSLSGGASQVAVTASGEVETYDKAGVFGPGKGFAPLWLYLPATEQTVAGPGIGQLAADVPEGSQLDRLHALMKLIHDRIKWEAGTTAVTTTAEAALAQGRGVCQDHAHVFIAAARKLGYPARYISGYLLMEGTKDQVASHAWAEAHVEGLGWVGFDCTNDVCPDERYVRLACGRDYREAAPVSGIVMGEAKERLAVSLTVEQ
jgi:transglutaminase-like putative cysteine protease